MPTSRGRRLLVYTATLLLSPMPMMPVSENDPALPFALALTGALLTTGSAWTMVGEWRIRPRMLVGTKILIASTMTSLCGIGILVGAAVTALKRFF